MGAEMFYTERTKVIEVHALGFDGRRVYKVCIRLGYFKLLVDEVNRIRKGFILQRNWYLLNTRIKFVKYFFEVITVTQVIAVC
jgi:hypothetical protein